MYAKADIFSCAIISELNGTPIIATTAEIEEN